MADKIFFVFVFLYLPFVNQAQKHIPVTDTLFITGSIEKDTFYTLSDLEDNASLPIPDQIIYNHHGDIKDTLTDLFGIPVKNLLAPVQYIYEKPSDLNAICFVFVASDGYKVVFSWNEIYNTQAGDHFFILTRLKGKELWDMDNRIAFISIVDLRSGRRYIKGLKTIEVMRL